MNSNIKRKSCIVKDIFHACGGTDVYLCATVRGTDVYACADSCHLLRHITNSEIQSTVAPEPREDQEEQGEAEEEE